MCTSYLLKYMPNVVFMTLAKHHLILCVLFKKWATCSMRGIRFFWAGSPFLSSFPDSLQVYAASHLYQATY